MMEEYSLRELKGIGEKTEKLFNKLNLYSVQDLLFYFPRSYDIFEEPIPYDAIKAGSTVTVAGTVSGGVSVRKTARMTIVTTTIKSESGQLSLIWFNMPYLRSTLKRGTRFLFRGKAARRQNQLILEQPRIYTPSQYTALVHTMQPIYSLTAGLSNQTVKKAVQQALTFHDLYPEYLDEDMRRAWHLADGNYALEAIHFPENMEAYRMARRRLAFDDFFFFILAVQRRKGEQTQAVNAYPMKRTWETEQVIDGLEFRLTDAQLRTWMEVERDLAGDRLMSRLIQGDVGSGKTIIAFLAMVMTARNGYQSALMVPTEVLAQQHFTDLQQLIRQQELSFANPVLLTGSVKGKERKAVYEQIETGKANMIIGTHALIQQSVAYDRLALVITDEQHRFGVKQREALSRQGNAPNVLVMSATPIPRTLAVILYGDLDISVIDELPARRLPIKNCVVNEDYRMTAWNFMKKQVEEGHQCYVICPMVEESEGMDGENVTDYQQRLQEFYGKDIIVRALSGRMTPARKEELMEAFVRGEIQVLVSTTVVEVGVNVPNASVMMVENAERFGLAQLHQLRGRVGRGDAQSYCIFLQGTQEEETCKRLQILNESNDGFAIAAEDLKLRGPGELFGVRQSGVLDFHIGDIYQDADVLKLASDAAASVLSMDEQLRLPQHRALRARLDQYMQSDLKDFCL